MINKNGRLLKTPQFVHNPVSFNLLLKAGFNTWETSVKLARLMLLLIIILQSLLLLRPAVHLFPAFNPSHTTEFLPQHLIVIVLMMAKIFPENQQGIPV